jgi:hypothetical protein
MNRTEAFACGDDNLGRHGALARRPGATAAP